MNSKSITEDLYNLIQRRVELIAVEDRLSMEREYKAFIAKASANGTSRSGMAVMKIAEISECYTARRIDIIWQTIHRFLTTTGINFTSTLEEELKSLISSFSIEDTKNFFLGKANVLGSSIASETLLNKGSGGIETKYQHELEKIFTEVELFCMWLKAKSDPQDASTIINNYGPVNSIQTGANSSSSNVINIDSSSKNEILNYLKQLSDDIQGNSYFEANKKHELLEVIDDSTLELNKQQFNSVKLGGFFNIIASSIQTVAALKPAYDTFKALLSKVGIF